ncbi:MAG: hypothetical protein F6K00_14650 [Leptolyngbya sp. SIOISBB]|nr:hypothetical protein [Leptolyngbya sp. SIOISBB]
MGRFDISCALAQTIVTAYGPKRTERTEVSFGNIQPDESRENPYARDDEIPVLNIDTNEKIQRWRQYVQTVRPFFSQNHLIDIDGTVSYPVDEVLAQLEGKVKIPILIPGETPKSSLLSTWIQEYGLCADIHSDGYGYVFEHGPPCASHATPRSLARFSARAIEHLPQYALDDFERHINPRDTWREVELARGVMGTFHTSCGPYCTSSLTWDYQGVRYSISGISRQPFMVRLANSAIEAGDRRLGAH